MDPYFSDHTPLCIRFDGVRRKAARPFKFFNCLAEHKILKIVEDNWTGFEQGSHMRNVWTKLQRVKQELKKLNQTEYARVEARVKVARQKLKEVQEQMRDHPQQPELFEVERKRKMQLEKWGIIEENIYKQKSRVKWLKLGDSNTSYFHACMKNNIAQNRIRNIANAAGELIQTDEGIEDEITRFYKLLGTSARQLPAIQIAAMMEVHVLDREQQLSLIGVVSREEVLNAIKDIDDSEAPACDGFNAFFFKKTWSILGEDIIDATNEFFETGVLYRPINCTVVTLIPKVKSPTTIRDNRPISYYTVLYKIIAKILTKRLKGLWIYLLIDANLLLSRKELLVTISY